MDHSETPETFGHTKTQDEEKQSNKTQDEEKQSNKTQYNTES